MPGPIDEDKNWPQTLVTHVKCTKCKELMDAPHCTKGGCPWCSVCWDKTKPRGKGKQLMITLLAIHLVNPGTDLVMCTKMQKNCNFTTLPAIMTCVKCQDHYQRNVEWYWSKLTKVVDSNVGQTSTMYWKSRW